jgi:hypothetical protein
MTKRTVLYLFLGIGLFLNCGSTITLNTHMGKKVSRQLSIEELEKNQEEIPILILTTDSDSIVGMFNSVEYMPLEQYAPRYDNYRKVILPGVIMPELNDRLVVVTKAKDEYLCQFMGFDGGKIVIKLLPSEEVVKVDPKYIEAIREEQNRYRLSPDSLSAIVREQLFPNLSRIKVINDTIIITVSVDRIKKIYDLYAIGLEYNEKSKDSKKDMYLVGFQDGRRASQNRTVEECVIGGNTCLSCLGGPGGVWLIHQITDDNNVPLLITGYVAGSIIGSLPVYLLSDVFIKTPPNPLSKDILYIKGFHDGINKTKKDMKRAAVWGWIGGQLLLLTVSFFLSGLP